MRSGTLWPRTGSRRNGGMRELVPILHYSGGCPGSYYCSTTLLGSVDPISVLIWKLKRSLYFRTERYKRFHYISRLFAVIRAVNALTAWTAFTPSRSTSICIKAVPLFPDTAVYYTSYLVARRFFLRLSRLRQCWSDCERPSKPLYGALRMSIDYIQ